LYTKYKSLSKQSKYFIKFNIYSVKKGTGLYAADTLQKVTQ